jgi:hypothetical protein
MIAVFCVSGFGLLVPMSASAASSQCLGTPTFAFGRKKWCGYFYNNYNPYGEDVRIGGVPSGTDHANEFINLIVGDLHSTSAHRRTAAQFIILTMLGRVAGLPKSVTETGTGSSNQLQSWEDRVRSYADTGENGSQSFGQNGRIDWHVWEHMSCGVANTYYQVAQDDIAPFANDTTNSNCGISTSKEEFIIFRDKSGNVLYRIRRACMNPMGVLRAIQPPAPTQYNLNPAITTTVNGAAISGGVEVGDTIRFVYTVRNSGTDPSPSTACTIYANVHSGYFPARGTPSPGGGAGPATGCPRTFNASSTVQLGGPEDVVVSTGNQTICRSLFVSPATSTIASRGVEACIPVINKPYFKVYGAGLSAGAGFETTPGMCTPNTRAAVIGWNRGSANGYAGASVQMAAFALSQIYEVSTAFGNTGAWLAPKPSGLAFANTTASGSVYGGMFGSLPCIANYYASKPATARPFTTLAAATTSDAYTWSGAVLNLSGALPAGKRVTLYVAGDVFINGDISYPASWTTANMPLFEVIVRGNIYISSTVSRIDGLFIAQKNGAAGGTIFTCALSAAPLAPDASLFNRCNRKLTINGVFVASQVRLLRTNGTVHQATAGETNSSGTIAEVFNFNPALWTAQPIGPVSSTAEYDAINSLPPIL